MLVKPPRGTRDWLPVDQIQRQKALRTIQNVFERFGFEPWEGPAIERAQLYAKKGSVEQKLMYRFKDLAGRQLVLRPEKTPTLARIIASNPLPKPIKWYNIGKSWRYERPQAGRYREFVQCDIDIIGVKEPYADAELLACAHTVLNELGLKNFTIKINSRALANQLLEDAGVAARKRAFALRIIDKLDKIGKDGVKKELLQRGISAESVNEIFTFIDLKGRLEKIEREITIDPDVKAILDKLVQLLDAYKIPNYIFDLSLVRGLDYYTGLVYEIVAGDFGSIAGGGRYDNLLKKYGAEDLPAAGIALGFERIYLLIKKEDVQPIARALIVPIGQTLPEAIELACTLRTYGIPIDIDLSRRRLSKSLNYANKRRFEYVILVGKEELAKRKFRLRNMKSGQESLHTIKQLIKILA